MSASGAPDSIFALRARPCILCLHTSLFLVIFFYFQKMTYDKKSTWFCWTHRAHLWLNRTTVNCQNWPQLLQSFISGVQISFRRSRNAGATSKLWLKLTDVKLQKLKNGKFAIEDKERSGRPKLYEDAELEALLDKDSCQTQEEQYDGQYFE